MPAIPERVVLTGFMATGKTAVGRSLARLLGYRFIDTDELLAQREGRSIKDIWLERGEAYFRVLEAQIAAELADETHCVIATGGGTLLSEENRALLSSRGAVICLHADSAVLLARLEKQPQRPLLLSAEGPQRIEELLAERDSIYYSFDHHIDTSELSPGQAAMQACQLLGLALPRLSFSAAAQDYPVVVRSGLCGDSSALEQYIEGFQRIFVLSNEVVFPLHGASLLAALSAPGRDVEVLTIPDGEQYKSFDTAWRLIDELAQRGAGRHSLIIGFGGGVVCDLAGFVASLYMRGLPLLQLPTSLLAQVDAAIGGKTAVDHPRAKNLAGTFHHPLAVLADPALLATLPRQEISNGLAEAIKTALIGSEELFARLEQQSTRALAGEIAFIEEVVRDCALIKATIVSADPRDEGLRSSLNLGHTVGHALEAAAGFGSLPHGAAVGLGMLCAAWIAARMGLAEPALEQRIAAALSAAGLPLTTRILERDAVLAALKLDKKSEDGRLRMVLPITPGEVTAQLPVELTLLEESLGVIAQ